MTDAHTALLACLPLLRREAVSLIECEGRLIPLEGGGYTLHPEPLDDEAADFAEPIIDAIRQAEAVVGRPEDDTPDWLNDILDGKREWRRTPA